MATLNAKAFIQKVYIEDLEKVFNQRQFYITFIVMGVGIEFLGKCLDTGSDNWNHASKRPNEIFNDAIGLLNSFSRYQQYVNSHQLYNSFRCGLAHASSPKSKITFSSGNETPHLQINGGRLNLKCEDFFADFKAACWEVINWPHYSTYDKVSQNFIEIPGNNFNDITNFSTGITGSFHH